MALVEKKRFDTPILLITFNRPDYVIQSLGEIRKQQPEKLYVFQDGARAGNENDVVKGAEVREVVKNMVDWPCELHTNYQEKNLGCGMGPYSAISWLFENEERGIIIEDDVVAHPLFFSFCKELLEKYDNQRFGMITGHNFSRRYSKHDSYYFTNRMNGTWGWATWRDVWRGFDFNIKYDRDLLDRKFKETGMLKPFRERSHKMYKKWLDEDRHSYWDFQFIYYLIIKGYLNARPNSCLTSHVGITSDGTHDFTNDPRFLMEVNEDLFKVIKHPKKIKIASFEKKAMYIKSLKMYMKRILHK